MNKHLILLIFFLFVVVLLLKIAEHLVRRRTTVLLYDRIGKLFSDAERSFLGVLEQVVGSQYRVFGKIRLADIIRPRKTLSKSAWATAKNRIDRKHVDFAICDPRTLQV